MFKYIAAILGRATADHAFDVSIYNYLSTTIPTAPVGSIT
jgi:hypothetical protein